MTVAILNAMTTGYGSLVSRAATLADAQSGSGTISILTDPVINQAVGLGQGSAWYAFTNYTPPTAPAGSINFGEVIVTFDLSSLPSDATINSITLTIYTSASIGSNAVWAHPIDTLSSGTDLVTTADFESQFFISISDLVAKFSSADGTRSATIPISAGLTVSDFYDSDGAPKLRLLYYSELQATSDTSSLIAIQGPATGSFAPKATFDYTPALTKVERTLSSNWRVRRRLTAPRTLSTTWKVRQRLTMTRASNWRVRARVTTSRASSWRVRQGVVRTLATSWAVRYWIERTAASGWSVRKVLDSQISSSWNVRARTMSTLPSSWGVRAYVDSARSTEWNVRETIELDVQTSWNVSPPIYRVDLYAHSAWGVRSLVETDVVSEWDVRARVRITHSTGWAVYIVTGSYVDSAWGVRAVATHEQDSLWDVRERVHRCLGSTWDVRAVVEQLVASAWGVRQALSLSLDTEWDIRELVGSSTAAGTTRWAVRTSLQETFDTGWDIRELVAAYVDSGWDLRAYVDSRHQTLWDVRMLVATDAMTGWSVLVAIETDVQTGWRVRAGYLRPSSATSTLGGDVIGRILAGSQTSSTLAPSTTALERI